MVKLRTNDRVSIPRAVSKIVERSGEEKKKKTDREGREEEKLSLLQVRLRIWKREPRIESFGVQRRIENGTQTSIVPATSGIVKYDRLLVKWDQNIGCRLASILPLAFPSPVPALLPPLLLRRTTRDEPWNDHDDSPFLEIHFRFDWSRSRVFFSLLLPFYQGKVFIFHAFGSIFTRCLWFFRIPGVKRRLTDTTAKRIASRPCSMSCEITAGIPPALLRTRLKLFSKQTLAWLVYYSYPSWYKKENFLE